MVYEQSTNSFNFISVSQLKIRWLQSFSDFISFPLEYFILDMILAQNFAHIAKLW